MSWADCVTGQDVSQQAAANQPLADRAAKKKAKGGRKSASKDAKGLKAASGSMSHATNGEEAVTVDFFVPDQDEQDENLEVQGKTHVGFTAYTAPTLHAPECTRRERLI